MQLSPSAPVGIFDSGIGGLSVLQHIHQLLPHEKLIYFADSGFAPYGEKSEQTIVTRCQSITEFLLQQHCKAIVIACNTATAAAARVLRAQYPTQILIGMEPGLKPACQHTRSGVVGVMATQGTLNSLKFRNLRDQLSDAHQVRFVQQACTGLADQIEKAEFSSPKTLAMLDQYLTPLLESGADTIVLGCTHYPFVKQQIRELLREKHRSGPHIELIDTGLAVARYLQTQLQDHGLLAIDAANPGITAYTTGTTQHLKTALTQLLPHLHTPVSVRSATGKTPVMDSHPGSEFS
ncbi:glutamate racemase [Undibacterium griseum]|uniref:Glutamate racemase n=1 Tax=Undibacterium griseum TaxID=2762295 RepID=A0ABR6YLX7_9BURK|nr:glutamate racemase [Undibacterium griseum]MBC3884803.1 glutamate racemase [Undibacterium griseum]